MEELIDPHLRRAREFFGPRAAGWDERFPDDESSYWDAIEALRIEPGDVVIDLGCGTGRALPLLQRTVGDEGLVIGVDVTPEMLRAASEHGRNARGRLMLADATRLPVASSRVDAIFAAGLLTHVPDPVGLLRTLARAGRPDCRLALFHPVGRKTLARRHGRQLQHDELLDPQVLPAALAAGGWAPDDIDDADHRYLALASKSDYLQTSRSIAGAWARKETVDIAEMT